VDYYNNDRYHEALNNECQLSFINYL
jgi:hypothetical protein